MFERNNPLRNISLTNDKPLNINKNNNIIKITEFKKNSINKNNNSMNINNFNNNNVYYSKHISQPANRKAAFPPLLIDNTFYKKTAITHKKGKNNIIRNINTSFKDVYFHKKIVSPLIKNFFNNENSQTQLSHKINTYNEISNNKNEFNTIFHMPTNFRNDNNKYRNKYNYNLKQINNITNVDHVNIHIYTKGINTEFQDHKKLTNKTEIQSYNNNTSFLNNNDKNQKYNKRDRNKIDNNLLAKRINNNRLKRKYNNYNNSIYDLTPEKGFLKDNTITEQKIIPTKFNYKKKNYKI